MSNFYIRGMLMNIVGALAILACVFLPVGTFNDWQGWVFFGVFEIASQAFGIYFLINDPKLLERRMKAGPGAETETSQKIIVWLIMIGFIALLVVPGFDHRYGWSPVPPYVAILGDALIVLAFIAFFFVLKQNSFAASTIQVEEGQTVVSTGLYGIVRHPMYTGALLMLIGIPLALGSWWPLAVLIVFIPVLVWRLVDEERFLHKNLAGYTEYTQKVHYRLVPNLW
jgi:protein-S-isoprenylcysteine O-methyltransferase Ste14